jgi:DNA polymerase bacteriophage-type
VTQLAHLDYETFSTVDLRRAGLWAYARHPSTRVVWAKFRLPDSGVMYSWKPGQRYTDELKRLFTSCTIAAYNAGFEYAITKYVYARQLGVKLDVPPEQWLDVMAVVRQCALPGSLGACADVLKVSNQKDKDGARLMRLFSFPRADGSQVVEKDNPAEFAKYGDYCAQDVRAECDVLAALPVKSLTPHEQRVWETDLKINERGVRINVAAVRGAIGIIGRAKKDGRQRLINASRGKVTSPGQRDRVKEFCASHGVKLDDCKKETIAAALLSPILPKPVANLLGVYDSLNVSSVAKFPAMLGALSLRDRVCGAHQYNAADTGRWGGRIVQFQNVPRPKQKFGPEVHALIAAQEDGLLEAWGDPLIVLRDALRHMLIPSAGRKLVVCDMASIEARVLGWLSGCKDYLRAFRDNLDLYMVTAGMIYNKSYEQIKAIYDSDENCEERYVGKKCVLGLGYGMGLDTFEDTLRKEGATTPRITLERAVKKYRAGFHEIPTYWKATEAAAIEATANPGREVRCGVVTFAMVDGYLTLKLPSGRRLWYPGARVVNRATKFGVKPTVRFFTAFGTKWFPSWTYGGKITENLAQAIARDLLAAALVTLEDDGHCPVLHVHDEVVCDSDTPDAALTAVKDALTVNAPKWARGLPLGCKGFITDFYRK